MDPASHFSPLALTATTRQEQFVLQKHLINAKDVILWGRQGRSCVGGLAGNIFEPADIIISAAVTVGI